jgi:hypothetical protein
MYDVLVQNQVTRHEGRWRSGGPIPRIRALDVRTKLVVSFSLTPMEEGHGIH